MKETMVKLNKTKSQFFEKINKIDKHLAQTHQEKKRKNQINKIRNEKGEVTTDKAEIQRIIRDYCEQGKEQWLCFARAAMKRYPMPKVRETK